MTTDHFKQFETLHQGNQVLILPNIWDAASALLCQAVGASALATSSAAVAWSLGYADGGSLPVSEHLGAIQRILRVSRIPVSIDIEDGYSSDPIQVAELVKTLSDLGVVGINIEDGNGSPQLLCEKIRSIRSALQGRSLFINARTDVYLNRGNESEDSLSEVIQRLLHYQNAGANGGFIPGLTSLAKAQRLAKKITIPLNLMLLPGMEAPTQFYTAGIRRLSYGAAPFQSSYALFNHLSKDVLKNKIPFGIFDHPLDYDYLNSEVFVLERGSPLSEYRD
ncbi:isocitrate lyase/phosphoenolpyruvate mutase family protein [Microbulbifer echini]|uniref:Isocitrate lyase/phosphoenolpyruvate mutase family protein n=1 Tax=Microbulbifer echini TaxID=1529067 RepID=A0ABV4NQ15_9GAMM